MTVIDTYQVNDYITLKLIKDDYYHSTEIFLNGKPFNQCMRLMFQLNQDDIKRVANIQSMDEFKDIHDDLRHKDYHVIKITPKEEFSAHCSNIQAWVDNDYNTQILEMNLAFPILKKLTELGDPIANRVYKDEIMKRIELGYLPVIEFLAKGTFFKSFTEDELNFLFEEFWEILGRELICKIVKKCGVKLRYNYAHRFLSLDSFLHSNNKKEKVFMPFKLKGKRVSKLGRNRKYRNKK